MKINQDVPAGKRLLFKDANEQDREFHGPCTVEMEVPDGTEVQLLDELPPAPDTRSEYNKLTSEQKFEALRKKAGYSETDIVAEAKKA